MTRLRTKKINLLAGAAVMALLCATPALAGTAAVLPTGGSVQAGSVSIGAASNNNLTVNQSSKTGIINWNSFSIGQGSSVQFNNGSGSTLNRVTGNLTSQIDGSLKATGSLYLVNPAGIVVGSNGVIQTGGDFVASTQDISNTNFQQGGTQNFNGNSNAVIVNAGKVGSLGGNVTLVAAQVQNSGGITAPNGSVGLAAGYQVQVSDTDNGSGRIAVQVGGADTQLTASGAIKAAAVELQANGGNVYALAGNTNAIIQATGINNAGGKIIFNAGPTGNVSIATNVNATNPNGTGGTIIAEGNNVTVTSNAVLDASGQTGGTILIGGDRHGGSDPSEDFVAVPVTNATNTTIQQSASIKANGSNGAGGNVVVWSNDHTIFNGTISATGYNGNGGFAEVSSHGVLDFTGTADLLSQGGTAGTLLLDPYDVVISTDTDSNSSNSGGTFTPTGTSVINVNTLETALLNGNVTITTGGVGSPGTDAGDITINATIEWAGLNNLTLEAYRNININADIVSANTSGSPQTPPTLTLYAGLSGNGVGTVTFAPGIMFENQSSLNNNLTSAMTVIYNPTSNPAGSVVNTTSYVASDNLAQYMQYTALGQALQVSYLVNTVYDLQNMQNNMAASYMLGTNIDASATASWNLYNGVYEGFRPVGTYSNPFEGQFNGQNYVIENLTIDIPSTNNVPGANAANAVGLFGYIQDSATTTNISNVGLIGGSVYGSSTGSSRKGYGVGALVGDETGSGTISNVYADGVSVSADTGPVGGLIGADNAATVENSYFNGTVTGNSGAAYAGGLIGYSSANISFSYSSGSVNSSDVAADVGGLVGYGSGGTISNTYSLASVSNTAGTSTEKNYVAGLVGDDSTTQINDSYATGALSDGSGTWICGVACGLAATSTLLTDTYWDTDSMGASYASGIPNSSNLFSGTSPAGATGLSTSQFTDGTNYATNFPGFTFSTNGTPGTWAPPGQGVGSDGNTYTYMPELYGISKILVVDPNNLTVAQGGALPTLTATVTGLQGQDTLSSQPGLSTTATNTTTTGSYTISVSTNPTVSSLTPEPYRIIVNTGTLTVAAATPITYTTTDGTTATYGTTTSADLGTVSFNGNPSGLSGSITLVNEATGATAALSANTPAGTYYEEVTSLSGSNAGLYSIAANGNTIGTLTINPAQLTIASQGNFATTMQYNGTTNAAVASSGSVGGTLYDPSSNIYLVLNGTLASANVGTQSIAADYSLGGSAAGNYVLTGGTGYTGSVTSQQVTAAPLTITANNISKTYGSTYTFSGNEYSVTSGQLYGSDAISSVSLSSPGAAASATVAGGPYIITASNASGTGLSNYTISYNPGTLAVTPVLINLTYSVANANGTYGTQAIPGGSTLNGVLAADQGNVAGTVTVENSSGNTVNLSATTSAGTYEEVVTGLSGSAASNYQIATSGNTTGTLTINPLQLTIATAGTIANKAYDGTTAATVATNGTLSGVIGSDAVSLSLGNTAFSDPNAGTGKAVTGTYSLTGAQAGDYTLASTTFNGMANITPAALTIATAGTVANKVYDATTNATAATDGGLSGVVSGDTVTLTLGDLAFANANVGNNKAVTGAYTLGGSSAANYTLANATFNGTANITPATLDYVADPASVAQGQPLPALGGSATGFVGNDTLANATTGTLSFSSPVTSTSIPGTYAIDGSGLVADNGNYTLAQAAGNTTALTIQASVPPVYVVNEPTNTSGFLANNGNSTTALVQDFANPETGGSGTGGNGGGGNGSPSGTPNNSGSNNPNGGVYPGNQNLGPYLKFASTP